MVRISIPGFLKGGRGTRADTVIGCTPLGKTKAEQFSLQGPEFAVLTDISEAGPSSLAEIGDRTGLSFGKVKAIAHQLMSKGYARKVSSEEG